MTHLFNMNLLQNHYFHLPNFLQFLLAKNHHFNLIFCFIFKLVLEFRKQILFLIINFAFDLLIPFQFQLIINLVIINYQPHNQHYEGILNTEKVQEKNLSNKLLIKKISRKYRSRVYSQKRIPQKNTLKRKIETS